MCTILIEIHTCFNFYSFDLFLCGTDIFSVSSVFAFGMEEFVVSDSLVVAEQWNNRTNGLMRYELNRIETYSNEQVRLVVIRPEEMVPDVKILLLALFTLLIDIL